MDGRGGEGRGRGAAIHLVNATHMCIVAVLDCYTAVLRSSRH